MEVKKNLLTTIILENLSDYFLTTYKITDKEVVINKSFISEKEETMRLSKISHVETEKGMVEKYFDSGRITIQDKEGNSMQLKSLKNPEKVMNRIDELRSSLNTQSEDSESSKGSLNLSLDTKKKMLYTLRKFNKNLEEE